MAKSLHSLIRLNEWRVDEARRELGARIKVVDQLQDAAARLEELLAAEQETARNDPQMAGFAYAGYARRAIQQREQLAQLIDNAEAEVAKAREILQAAYRELKKFELTQAERDRREAAELARKDQIVLDEIAAEGHRRKSS